MRSNFASVDEEYKKYEELRPEDVKILMEWIEKQPHLPKVTELKAIFFLQSCYFKLEATKVCIEKFYTIRSRCPEFFTNRNISAIKDSLESLLITVLPKKTKYGYTVMLLKLMDTNPEKYNFNQHIKAIDMVVSLNFMIQGTSTGQVMILDMEGANFSHLLKINLIGMKKYMYYLQEALHARIKEIHITNASTLTDKLLSMVKPFIKSELFDSIYVHTKFDTLYERIPREILPKEYGGFSSTLKEMQHKTMQLVEDNGWYFMEESREVVDESKRPGKSIDIDGAFASHGSFKKLNID